MLEKRAYARILEELFLRAYRADPKASDIPFSKADLVEVQDRLVRRRQIRKVALNVPDIRYTFCARSEMPARIAQTGHWAIAGAGKGEYVFSRLSRPNRILIPRDIGIVSLHDSTPRIIIPFMSGDEQSILTRIFYNDVLARVLGTRCYRLQGHQRTFVPDYGQVEVDEQYVIEGDEGRSGRVCIEAKSPQANDLLNIAQLHGLARFILSQKGAENSRLIGVKPLDADTVAIGEFAISHDIRQIMLKSRMMAYRFET